MLVATSPPTLVCQVGCYCPETPCQEEGLPVPWLPQLPTRASCLPLVVVAQALHLLPQWVAGSGPRCWTHLPDAWSVQTIGLRARLAFGCWACQTFLHLGAWAGCSQMWSGDALALAPKWPHCAALGTSSADSKGELRIKPDNQGGPHPRARNIFISKENCNSGNSMWTQEWGSHHSRASTSLLPLWAPCHGNLGVAVYQSSQVWTPSEVRNRRKLMSSGSAFSLLAHPQT